MKVLILVISSDTETVYDEHKKVWLSYMNSNPDIDCYFIQYRNGIQSIEGNIFWLNGKESFSGIIHKTLDSLEYFMNNNYDFIIRTNLSSVWNFDVLFKHLQTLPRKNIYSGFIGYHNSIRFVSGSGIIMTPDLVQLLLKNRKIVESVNILDDVDIGYTFNKLGIPILSGRRNDRNIYDKDTYHYRCKQSDRYFEIETMKKLLTNWS